MELAVHLSYDPEARNWGFRVPALRIVGGGQATREEAAQAAMEAIAVVLEVDSRDAGSADGEVVEYYHVTLDKAS
jgi:hypothetical protein